MITEITFLSDRDERFGAVLETVEMNISFFSLFFLNNRGVKR